VIALLGNLATAALWIQVVLSTPRGGYGRYIIESGISTFIAIATFALTVPFVVACFDILCDDARPNRSRSRVVALIALTLAFMPMPLGIFLMRFLASWREITLT
jgi:hypothetical protein